MLTFSQPYKNTPMNTILGCVAAKLDKGIWLKRLRGVAISRSCEVLSTLACCNVGPGFHYYYDCPLKKIRYKTAECRRDKRI